MNTTSMTLKQRWEQLTKPRKRYIHVELKQQNGDKTLLFDFPDITNVEHLVTFIHAMSLFDGYDIYDIQHIYFNGDDNE